MKLELPMSDSDIKAKVELPQGISSKLTEITVQNIYFMLICSLISLIQMSQ